MHKEDLEAGNLKRTEAVEKGAGQEGLRRRGRRGRGKRGRGFCRDDHSRLCGRGTPPFHDDLCGVGAGGRVGADAGPDGYSQVVIFCVVGNRDIGSRIRSVAVEGVVYRTLSGAGDGGGEGGPVGRGGAERGGRERDCERRSICGSSASATARRP